MTRERTYCQSAGKLPDFDGLINTATGKQTAIRTDSNAQNIACMIREGMHHTQTCWIEACKGKRFGIFFRWSPVQASFLFRLIGLLGEVLIHESLIMVVLRIGVVMA